MTEGKAGISSPPRNGIFVSLAGLKDFAHFNLSFHLIFCGPRRCLGLPELPKPQVGGVTCRALGQVEWAARRSGQELVLGAVVVPGLWLPAIARSPGSCACPTLPLSALQPRLFHSYCVRASV